MVRYKATPTKRMRTKRKKKDMDEIYQDLTRKPDIRKIAERKPDLDLPALGNFYCIVCARYFNSQEILDGHCQTKTHKKRCKKLATVPYGTDIEEVYGKIDHGVELTPANLQPVSQEVQKTSTRQYFAPDNSLRLEIEHSKPQKNLNQVRDAVHVMKHLCGVVSNPIAALHVLHATQLNSRVGQNMFTAFSVLKRVRCTNRSFVAPSRLCSTMPSGENTAGTTDKLLEWFEKSVTKTPQPDRSITNEKEVQDFMVDLFGESFGGTTPLDKVDLRGGVIKSIKAATQAEDLTNLKNLLANPVRSAINKSNRELQNLEYWDLYPKQIKKWLVFTKSKQGFYDGTGKWIEIKSYDLDFSEDALEDEDSARWMDLYEEEQTRLAPDLRGRFRFGVTFDEIKDFHPKIVRLFSMTFASEREKLALRKQLAIEKWKQHEFDTASDAIQIDILTQRIRALAKHLQNNKQDKHNARFLQKLLKRRKGIMLHLKKRDVPLYYEVLREIKLRDLYELYY